jgi:hypothetical protein
MEFFDNTVKQHKIAAGGFKQVVLIWACCRGEDPGGYLPRVAAGKAGATGVAGDGGI